jgi:hypothetical protein
MAEAYVDMSKIYNFGRTSFFIGELLDVGPFGEKERWYYIPKPFYFNGGSYFKFGFYFMGHIIEFCHPKKGKTVYKQVTSEEMDRILKDLK